MSEQTVVHATFVTKRHYPKPPERVFKAFADPVQKRRWFGEGPSHNVVRYEMDFRTGGAELLVYRMNEKTPFPGVELVNAITFQDIVPDKRIVISQVMDLGGRRISAALITFEMLRADGGTDLVCTHQGAFFEGADGPQLREQGWNALFDRLAKDLA